MARRRNSAMEVAVAGATTLAAKSSNGTAVQARTASSRGVIEHATIPCRAGSNAPVQSTFTILVEWDDPKIRDHIEQVLQTYGYHVLQATDGVDAIRVVAQHSGPIHLLLSDINRLRLDGRDLRRRPNEATSLVSSVENAIHSAGLSHPINLANTTAFVEARGAGPGPGERYYPGPTKVPDPSGPQSVRVPPILDSIAFAETRNAGPGPGEWHDPNPTMVPAPSAPKSVRAPSILVINDDEYLQDTIAQMLEREGFKTAAATEGRSGLERTLMPRPDLILIDMRPPGMRRVEICKQLRAAQVNTPIIVLSADGDETDEILLLEMGADDYVVEPFSVRELVARIRAVLRRCKAEECKVMRVGDVEVDLERRVVTRGTEEIKLTPAEYNLLLFFLHHPDCPLSRDMILNFVWGYSFMSNTRTVDAHILKLRKKLEPDPKLPAHILTLHGVGYRFVP